ncbi:MAG: triphosphoribosyl-dephospho-CoA synthase [Gemmataceae bacterium]|nr:triphosphoribosyl-dephospho-CoA synthase [Gemmataceae bacterium]MDW8241789.1 triphosphoribosyl-dephospho-CoA synthase [Thermogemmata sp.]
MTNGSILPLSISQWSCPQSVAALEVQIACIWEVLARKVGNVHRYRDFSDTALVDFLLSAAACAGPLCQSATPLGQRVYQAVMATRQVVRTNTNLGIILLLAPLVGLDYTGNWVTQLGTTLAASDIADSQAIYAAIRLAQPGGLGESPSEDVRTEPTRPVKEIMALAAERDQIARQYATGYADVVYFGLPLLAEKWRQWGRIEAAIIDCQLHWLATFPDSLIARKNGAEAATHVQRLAQEVLQRGGLTTSAGREAAQQLDATLRSGNHRLNPGTTADLITACLFIALRTRLLRPTDPFSWEQPDWLSGPSL